MCNCGKTVKRQTTTKQVTKRVQPKVTTQKRRVITRPLR